MSKMRYGMSINDMLHFIGSTNANFWTVCLDTHKQFLEIKNSNCWKHKSFDTIASRATIRVLKIITFWKWYISPKIDTIHKEGQYKNYFRNDHLLRWCSTCTCKTSPALFKNPEFQITYKIDKKWFQVINIWYRSKSLMIFTFVYDKTKFAIASFAPEFQKRPHSWFSQIANITLSLSSLRSSQICFAIYFWI